jgi:uncharacterized oxidoreductase
MLLDGRKILVTGGTTGIGAAIVAQLVQRRCQVIVCARHAPQDGWPSGVIFRACDLTSTAQRKALVAWVASEHADTAVLINNAAVQHLFSFATGDQVEIERLTQLELSLNLEAPMLLIAGLLPTLMAQPAAAIVNITTGLALAPKRSSPVYCATKAALRSFTRSLRYQLEQQAPHVQVQEVLPPLVDTRMTQGRGSGKMAPADVAHALIVAIEHNVNECYVGKSKLLRVVMQIAPSIAHRLLKEW